LADVISTKARKEAVMDASQIKEHMDVVGSDDQHVGTVDHVEGQRIKLARKDSSSEGKHHYIGLDKVSSVQDGRVRLACSVQEARQA
jgi:hypothetical protein